MGLTVQAVSFSFALLNRKFAIREIKKRSIAAKIAGFNGTQSARGEELYHLF